MDYIAGMMVFFEGNSLSQCSLENLDAISMQDLVEGEMGHSYFVLFLARARPKAMPSTTPMPAPIATLSNATPIPDPIPVPTATQNARVSVIGLLDFGSFCLSDKVFPFNVAREDLVEYSQESIIHVQNRDC